MSSAERRSSENRGKQAQILRVKAVFTPPGRSSEKGCELSSMCQRTASFRAGSVSALGEERMEVFSGRESSLQKFSYAQTGSDEEAARNRVSAEA